MKITKYLIIATIFLSLLIACVDENYPPIFYTLANEYSIVDERGLEDNAGILEIVKADGNYFALTNKLIYRTDSGDPTKDVWKPEGRKAEYNLVPAPAALGGDAVCLSLEVESGDLFAGFFEFGDPDKGGLYYTDIASDPGNINWTLVSDADLNDTQIKWIKSIGTGELFVAALKTDGSGDYMLYSSTTPTTIESYDPVIFAGGDPTGNLPIVDVAWDGADYWVIVGPYLYRGTLGALTLESELGDPKAIGGRNFTGLLGVPGAPSQVYLSGIAKDQDDTTTDDASNLWMTDDSGSSWTRQRVLGDPTDDESDLISLSTFVDLTGTSSNILIGTVGFGYVELDTGPIGTATIGRPDPAEIGGLDEAAVNSFYPTSSPAPLVVFACTAGSGLWRADWDDVQLKWFWNRE